MATGIKSKNSQSIFADTKIASDGVGIDLEDDKSTFFRTTIVVGENIDYNELIKQFHLPENVPVAHLTEAVEEIRSTKNPAVLEQSKLKQWLYVNGFDMAFWAQTALAIVTFAFSPSGA
ncbi:putative PqqD family protein [Pseudomonas serboccidentalis]